jgi:lipid A disaccharide synthetase
VTELIQENLTRENLKTALETVLIPENIRKMKEEYAELRKLLGGGGASDTAAKSVTF